MRTYTSALAGVFNPAFATYRMSVTADTHLSRVVGAWAMTSKLVQPACIAAAGLLATAAGIRTAIAALSVVLLACAALLPWTALMPSHRTRRSTADPRADS